MLIVSGVTLVVRRRRGRCGIMSLRRVRSGGHRAEVEVGAERARICEGCETHVAGCELFLAPVIQCYREDTHRASGNTESQLRNQCHIMPDVNARSKMGQNEQVHKTD